MGASGRLLGLRRAAAVLAARGGPEEASQESDVERVLRSRAKAARERRIQRLMEPPRAPERTLTRQAMEQIRFLAREWPEEWPVPRLAQGFQVSPDVVLRVLRSRFLPSPQRARKQDARAAGEWQGGPGRPTELPRLLDPETTIRRLLPPATAAASKLGWRKPTGEEEEEESRRGFSVGAAERPWLDPEELAEESGHPSYAPPPPPVQRGREFFDQDGNLLYRIPEGSPSSSASAAGEGAPTDRQE